MKPHVICHMAASVDGRILPIRWRPGGLESDLYERLHEQLGGQAWLTARSGCGTASTIPDAAT